MATTLFTRKNQRVILKYWEYTVSLFVLFLACSYFSTPTCMVSSMGISSEIIKSIELKRESNKVVSKSTGQYYSDFYEFKMNETKFGYRVTGDLNMSEIKNYGIKKLIGENVDLQFNQKPDYRIIRELQLDDKIIVHKKDNGFFPYLLFVVLTLVFFGWSVWGFYIAYLVSDERRKEFGIK